MIESLEGLQRIISNRRTVKPDHYTDETIPDEHITQILESANWAPTHGYTEPWRFTVFTGNSLPQLGKFLAELDQPDPEAAGFNAARFERLRQRPSKASHVIAIGMKRGDNPKVPEVEEICSVAMAVQNMWLTAHALGLGAYWSTGALAFTDEVRDFIGLESGDRSLGFFYLGKTESEPKPGRRLSPISDKVKWH